jgi:hypothetical protein
MAYKKKSKKPITPELNRPVWVVIVMAVILTLIITIFSVLRFIAENKTLEELSFAGADLKTVYSEIIKDSQYINTASYFRYECHESNTEIGRGQISCGPTAVINFNKETSLLELKNSIANAIKNSGLFENVSSGVVSDLGMSLSFQHGTLGCSVSGNSGAISIYCQKSVPDFLPGYTIE